MKITEAKFVKSAPDYQQCPPENKPEYAFIGRSNVGKSSLINMITEQKGLAKTSQTPGKTQLINHFGINNAWYLVDLPGYGYAKVSKTERDKWESMIWNYLTNRKNLLCVFVLIDVRHEPQKIDLAFVNRLGAAGVPFKLVFTKYDKVKAGEGQRNINKFTQAMSETWEILPEYFITSAERKIGGKEVLQVIEEINSVTEIS